MRKTFLSIAALIAVAISSGQTGTILVGGNASFNTSKNTIDFANNQFYNITKSTTFEITPLIGYQFDENWTGGLVGSLSLIKGKYNNTSFSVRNKSYAIGPFVRYTHQLSDIFSVFGQFEGQYQTFDGADQRGLTTKLFPAIFINVKNGFGLNFDFGGIEYEAVNYKNAPSELRSSRFGINFGKTMNVGISKNF